MVTVSTIAERNAVPNAIRYVSRADGLIDVYQVGDTLPDQPAAPAPTYERVADLVVVGMTGAAIQAAIDATGGGPVQLQAGRYELASRVYMKAGVWLRGAGISQTELYATADGFPLLDTTGIVAGDLTLTDLTLWGYADRNPVLAEGLRGCYIRSTTRLTIERVRCIYMRNMGLTGKAPVVRVHECEVENVLRDAINLSGSKRITVSRNKVKNAGDDAIAVHVESSLSAAYTLDYSLSVTDNEMEMCQGIKVLGAQSAVIANNRLTRGKGYGVYVAADTGYGEGIASMKDIVISGNIIRNLLNPAVLGGTDILYGIYLAGVAQIGASGYNATGQVPGEFASGAWVAPESYDRLAGGAVGSDTAATAGSVPTATMTRIKIVDNIIVQDLPAATPFSALGYGGGWHTSGATDPASVSFMGLGSGIRLNANLNNVTVRGNTLYGWNIGLEFGQWSASEVTRFRSITIDDNDFIECNNAGSFAQGSGTRHFVATTVDRNRVNLDPYLRHADRSSTGAWVNTTTPNRKAWDVNNTAGLVFRENTYRNTKAAFHGAAFYSHTRPTYYGDPLDSAIGHSGVHTFTDIDRGGTLIREISTPVSADYLKYQETLRYDQLAATAMPSAGWYPAGVFVRHSSAAPDAGKILAGWFRRTTGNAHVSGTDWDAHYATVS